MKSKQVIILIPRIVILQYWRNGNILNELGTTHALVHCSGILLMKGALKS
jgi:hypothetical protein